MAGGPGEHRTVRVGEGVVRRLREDRSAAAVDGPTSTREIELDGIVVRVTVVDVGFREAAVGSDATTTMLQRANAGARIISAGRWMTHEALGDLGLVRSPSQHASDLAAGVADARAEGARLMVDPLGPSTSDRVARLEAELEALKAGR